MQNIKKSPLDQILTFKISFKTSKCIDSWIVTPKYKDVIIACVDDIIKSYDGFENFFFACLYPTEFILMDQLYNGCTWEV